MGDYVIALTTETDQNGMIKKSGNINGGFYQKTDDPEMNYPSVVIEVPNIHESIERIKNAGGTYFGRTNANSRSWAICFFY